MITVFWDVCLGFLFLLVCLCLFLFSNRALTQVQKILSISSVDPKCLRWKVIFIQLSHSHASCSYFLCHPVRKNCTKLQYSLTFEELTDSVHNCYQITTHHFIFVAIGKISPFCVQQVRITELADGSATTVINTRNLCTNTHILRLICPLDIMKIVLKIRWLQNILQHPLCVVFPIVVTTKWTVKKDPIHWTKQQKPKIRKRMPRAICLYFSFTLGLCCLWIEDWLSNSSPRSYS